VSRPRCPTTRFGFVVFVSNFQAQTATFQLPEQPEKPPHPDSFISVSNSFNSSERSGVPLFIKSDAFENSTNIR
jgi:hypothetical protein